MAPKRKKARSRQRGRPRPAPAAAAVEDEIERFLATPLPELLGDEDLEREAERMAQQVASVPAMARLHDLVSFVGDGRPATAAGNLKPADAAALAERLFPDHDVPAAIGSLDDLPAVASLFRWAVAAELLAHRRGRIVRGPLAPALTDDPLSAWFKAATVLIEHGVLDGFRSGWRKEYVPLLDGSVPILLGGLASVTQPTPLPDLEDIAWTEIAEEFGYDRNDRGERDQLRKLLETLVDALVDIGIVARHGRRIALTELGGPLGAAIGLGMDDGGEADLDDLVDVDALSLILTCAEADVEFAWTAISAWCRARAEDEAADELALAVEDAGDDAGAFAVGVLALWSLGDGAQPARRRLLAGDTIPPAVRDVLRTP